MKKIKLLSILVAVSLFFTGCGLIIKEEKKVMETKQTEEKQAKENLETTETTESTETQKEVKEVKLEDLRSLDKDFIVINGEKISYEKFYKFYDLYAGVLAIRQGLSQELTSLLIRDLIVTKDLNDKNISVTPEEIDAEIQLYVKNLGSEAEFNKYINMLGVSMDVFRANIENSIKNEKHKELFIKENPVSDDQAKQYYEVSKDQLDSIDAKHILVEDEQLAKEISDKIKNGEDFKALSEAHNLDQTARKNGGELGRIQKDKLDVDFANDAFELEEGKVSDPIKTQFGYHVVVVNKKFVGYESHVDEIKKVLAVQAHEASLKQKVSESDIKFFDTDGKEMLNQ